jgi:hypothetical protein
VEGQGQYIGVESFGISPKRLPSLLKLVPVAGDGQGVVALPTWLHDVTKFGARLSYIHACYANGTRHNVFVGNGDCCCCCCRHCSMGWLHGSDSIVHRSSCWSLRCCSCSGWRGMNVGFWVRLVAVFFNLNALRLGCRGVRIEKTGFEGGHFRGGFLLRGGGGRRGRSIAGHRR